MSNDNGLHRLGLDVFSTGMVARMLGVAARTVCKWCDSGKLPHYCIPDSNDRRIERNDLIDFLKKNGVPIPPRLGGPCILVIGRSPPPAFQPGRVIQESDLFTAGRMYQANRPVVVVLDVSGLGAKPALALTQLLKASDPSPFLVVWQAEDQGGLANSLVYLNEGADAVFDSDRVTEMIEAVAHRVIRVCKERLINHGDHSR